MQKGQGFVGRVEPAKPINQEINGVNALWHSSGVNLVVTQPHFPLVGGVSNPDSREERYKIGVRNPSNNNEYS